jgi:hypothetical protein
MNRKTPKKAGLYLAHHRQDGLVCVVVKYNEYKHHGENPGFLATKYTGENGHCSYNHPGRKMREEFTRWRLIKAFLPANAGSELSARKDAGHE